MRELLTELISAPLAFLFKAFLFALSSLITLAVGQTAFAHEVYVLDPTTVSNILSHPSPNPFQAIDSNRVQFFTWTFIAIMIVTVVFLVSIFRPLEKRLDPLLFGLKRQYGFFIIRLTVGLSLIASGWYGAIFGPELPLREIYGVAAPFLAWLFVILGLSITVGFLTRPLGLLALLIVFLTVFTNGSYMLTYSNYFGDIIFVGFIGAHIWSVDKHLLQWHGVMGRLERLVERYAFLILRVTFGFSLIYASLYAKFIHSELALRTVIDYNLTNYFHFPPLFIVLGACLVEITLGIFFIIGFEIRFAALFLMVFLTLSLLYFGEAVWPHIVLFGGALALFVHGYDRYTVEGYFFKDAKHEPIL